MAAKRTAGKAPGTKALMSRKAAKARPVRAARKTSTGKVTAEALAAHADKKAPMPKRSKKVPSGKTGKPSVVRFEVRYPLPQFPSALPALAAAIGAGLSAEYGFADNRAFVRMILERADARAAKARVNALGLRSLDVSMRTEPFLPSVLPPRRALVTFHEDAPDAGAKVALMKMFRFRFKDAVLGIAAFVRDTKSDAAALDLATELRDHLQPGMVLAVPLGASTSRK